LFRKKLERRASDWNFVKVRIDRVASNQSLSFSVNDKARGDVLLLASTHRAEAKISTPSEKFANIW
jgi:hypothetical protein